MHTIENGYTAMLPSVRHDDVGRLARFLDTHFVLYFKNADEWYVIHPMIREEVAEIVWQNPLTKPDPG